jgi:sulfur relay (sulfurtransferase) DsrF/TusC family protein
LPDVGVLVVLRRSPFNTGASEEGLRVAVGLTIANPRVGVLLVDDAAWLATGFAPAAVDRPDLAKHWQMLGQLGVWRGVERESLAERGIAEAALAGDVEIVARGEVAELLASTGKTIVH